uniref:Uncharacterized protein n=1 Tax=viral metagenome TaxID=1070528 RepID=A0A6M3LIJ2_9ZZZZ
MFNQTMCEDNSLSKRNRHRVEHNEGGLWHREQESLTKSWKGGDKPFRLKTYDLPIAGKTTVTHKRPRTKEEE